MRNKNESPLRDSEDIPNFQKREPGIVPFQTFEEEKFPSSSEILREKNELVRDCKGVMEIMPKGNNGVGVVLGSGSNTLEWNHKGWATLDIDPEIEGYEDPIYGSAHFTDDANLLNELPTDSVDYLLAERITFDPLGNRGVTPAALLAQANRTLNLEGKLIIDTAAFEGVKETTIPSVDEMTKLLRKHGFTGVVDLGEVHEIEAGGTERKAVYYCEKKREGYKREDGKIIRRAEPGTL